MPVTDHLPRTLGPYRLQDRLGEGGMGVVHLARDPEGRAVAVKVLHPLGTEGVNARRRLAREVETMRRVRSPYVAEVLDADVTGEFPYIVTRFVTGPTLDEMVRDPRPAVQPGAAPARPRHGRGADRDPRGGRGAPRPEAGQRDALRRPAHRHRLRHRAGRRRHPADPDRAGHGYPRLPGPRGDRGRAQQPGLGRALLGLDHGVRGHRPSAVRRRFLRDDLLPDHLRARRPERRSRAAGPADLRGPGPGPLAPALRGWLSAQAVTLDMSAATATYAGAPLTETQYPREVVSIPAVPSAAPPAPAARVAAARRRPSRRPGTSPTCCRRSATRGTASSRTSRRTGIRLARGARRAPSPPGPYPHPRARAGLPPRRPAEHRRRTRPHGRAGGADRGAAGGRAARRRWR